MRYENQIWNQVKVFHEIVVNGVPTTGLSPTTRILRISDNQWFDGANWQGTPTDIPLVETSAANLPGFYQYDVPTAELDLIAGQAGYLAEIKEGTTPVHEHIRIQPTHIDDDLIRMLGLRQQNMRQTNATFHVSGQPETGTIRIYANAADAIADTAHIGEYSFTATYDGSGQLLSYVSTKVS